MRTDQTGHDVHGYDVLVVGAGPSGLTTAAALARYGVRVLVVERHAGTSIFPKATGVRPRTMEILRSWGLEGRVRAREQHVRLAVSVSETLAGPSLAEHPIGVPAPEVLRALSPTTFAVCSQDHLEPILLEHLLDRGGEVRFRTRLVGFAADGDGVTARLRGPAGGTDTVRARFLVGADGSDSPVRLGLGIGVEELGTEGEHLAMLFRTEQDPLRGRPRYALHWVTSPGAEGMLVAGGDPDRWVYDREWHPERGESLADWPAERCVAAIRAAVGLPGLEPQLLRTFPWSFGAAVATAQRAGNGFLVGDAAHRTTPRGATGMNTGIADAHNLGWKLAWVLRGWAGESLLDSYAEERRPIGVANALRSLEETKDGEEHGIVQDFGLAYRSGAVVPDGTPDPRPGEVLSDGRPGSRAPHAVVEIDGRQPSTLDLFDGRLTVLTGPDDVGWRSAAAGPAASGLPIAVLAVGRELHDPDGGLLRRYGLGASGAVLVRPDGHVAWRRADGVVDAGAELRRALTTALGRRTGTDERALAG